MAAWHGEAQMRPWSSIDRRNYTRSSSRQLMACSPNKGAAKHTALPIPRFQRYRHVQPRSAGAHHQHLEGSPLLLLLRIALQTTADDDAIHRHPLQQASWW